MLNFDASQQNAVSFPQLCMNSASPSQFNIFSCSHCAGVGGPGGPGESGADGGVAERRRRRRRDVHREVHPGRVGRGEYTHPGQTQTGGWGSGRARTERRVENFDPE